MTYLPPFVVHHGASCVISCINQKVYSKMKRNCICKNQKCLALLLYNKPTCSSTKTVFIWFLFVLHLLVVLLCKFLQIVLWYCICFPQLDCKVFKAKGHECDFFGSSSHFQAQHSVHILGAQDVLEDCLKHFYFLFNYQNVRPRAK